MKVEEIEIHVGTADFEYTPIRQLEAKCEAATNFSPAPTMDAVNGKLRQLAAQVGANAIVHMEYHSGISMTSWRSMKGTGLAVRKLSDDMACPTCAETIKRAAVKCRFCGADVPRTAPVPERAARRGPAPAPHSPRTAASVMSQEPLKSSDNPLPWVLGGLLVLFLMFSILANA